MALYGFTPKQECQFVHNVMDELDKHRQKSSLRSVLLFPPLPSRLRYLIHKTIEDQPEFTTFSVGESWRRRVVVCHSELRAEADEDSDLESNNGVCEESQRNKGRDEAESNAKSKPSLPSRTRGPKRPDKPLYMPRAARARLSLQNTQEPAADHDVSSPASRSCSCISSSLDTCPYPETTENTESSSTAGQESPPRVEDGVLNHVSDGSELCPQVLHEAEPAALDQTVSCFRDMTLEEDEKDKDDLASVTLCDVTEEVKAHLREAVTVSIEHVQNDYSMYTSVSPDEFGHVIEIYNFPAAFTTDDLLDAFTEYSDCGMKIKWVDNTHALGVFSSESAALHALSVCHPLLKVRALAKGSKQAQDKAVRCAEYIQPVKERPRTDCAVARRMVTRALGLQGRGRVLRY